MRGLLEPWGVGGSTAPNRIVFGPHETNLGRGRSLSPRHVAYYEARAVGGAGVIVTEEASVDPTDWPYERAPLAAECAWGWEEVSARCHEHGSLVLAALGHAGGQGSSAYHQRALLAPSRVPDVVTRESPAAMEPGEIDALVTAFAAAARVAVAAGCDGVELNAGQFSLLRQFASGLTNRRDDGYGSDRMRLVAEVLSAVRAAAPGAVVGLRISCDELAPWGGIVPGEAAAGLRRLTDPPDYVTVVRGSAFATSATRPDGHTGPWFNREATAEVRRSLPPGVAVVAQGSIVEAELAEEIVAGGEADAVEMTRAQIADPTLARKLSSGARVRPCVLCNQTCQVRDVRNPIVTCIAEPLSGHETEGLLVGAGESTLSSGSSGPARAGPARRGARSPVSGAASGLLVVGGGPAGLECARVAALGGLRTVLVERDVRTGGMVRAAARLPGHERLERLLEHLSAECLEAGVELCTGHEASGQELGAYEAVVLCTGSRPGRRSYEVVGPAAVLTAAEVLGAGRPGRHLRHGARSAPAVVWDPVGGPAGVGVAELLAADGGEVVLVTPDFVAGVQLARSGDMVPANVRLRRAGVELMRRTVVKAVDPAGVTLQDRATGERRLLGASLLVDAGHRLPEDSLYRSLAPPRAASPAPPAGRLPAEPGRRVLRAGDAVAPRTIHEAVLEGRRAALLLLGTRGQPAVTGP